MTLIFLTGLLYFCYYVGYKHGKEDAKWKYIEEKLHGAANPTKEKK
jgi:hypothetical protein